MRIGQAVRQSKNGLSARARRKRWLMRTASARSREIFNKVEFDPEAAASPAAQQKLRL